MNPNQFLAHPDQSLVKHLIGVARLAKGLAAYFQGEDHGERAGLLHDLGKAEECFKARVVAIKARKKENPGDNNRTPITAWHYSFKRTRHAAARCGQSRSPSTPITQVCMTGGHLRRGSDVPAAADPAHS